MIKQVPIDNPTDDNDNYNNDNDANDTYTNQLLKTMIMIITVI